MLPLPSRSSRFTLWLSLLILGFVLSAASPEAPKGPAERIREAIQEQAEEVVKKVLEATSPEEEEPASPKDEEATPAKDEEATPPKGEEATDDIPTTGKPVPPEEASDSEPTSPGGDDTDDDPVARKLPPKVIDISGDSDGVIYRIIIDDVIDLGLAPYVERVVEAANADPETVAILSIIHTPGGRVDAAVRIRDALLDAEHPTFALVDSEAISAGALIALAHDYIIMTPGGTIGAATPIQLGGGGEATAVGEKTVSYVRGVFRATAEAKDRDPVIAEAMVDAEIHVKGLAPKGRLLTATTRQALAWGIADLEVDNEKGLLMTVGLTEPRMEAMEVNWAEAIARVVTHPVLSGLLMSFGFLGILMELYSPGFGGVGAVGLACLLVFFFGHYVVHLAGMEEFVLFGAGVLLLLIELLVIPGFGFVGVAGVVVIVVSLAMALVDTPMPVEVSFDMGLLTDALLRVMISLLGTAAAGVLILTRLPTSTLFRRFSLAETVAGQAVSFGTTGDEEPPAVGSPGTATTTLRPAGKVRVERATYDAITSGEHIERGETIHVTGTRGSSLVVAASPGESEDSDG